MAYKSQSSVWPIADVQALFTEDEEGHTGPFLNLLRTQGDEERDTYIEEIVKQLEGMEQVLKEIWFNTL